MAYYEDERRYGTYRAFGDSDLDDYRTYVRIDEIYRGNNNQVYIAERTVPGSSAKELCIAKETGFFTKVGYSRYRPDEATRENAVDFDDYLKQLSIVDHANVVKFYGHGKSKSDSAHHGISQLVLISEYCPGGDLENFLDGCTEPFPTAQILAYLSQILNGLCHLHNLKVVADGAKNVIHGDIKPRNIFLCNYKHGVGYMTIKIGDHDDPVHMLKTKTQADDVKKVLGTIFYMSPEICLLREEDKKVEAAANIGRRTDTWSVGCVVLKMCLGKEDLRFSLRDQTRTESDFGSPGSAVTGHLYRGFVALGATPVIPDHLDAQLATVISSCLIRDCKVRPTANDIAVRFAGLLSSASAVFLNLPATSIEIGKRWESDFMLESEKTSLQTINSHMNIADYHWITGYLRIMTSKANYDLEWLHTLHKLQKASFDGPVLVQCEIEPFTAVAVLKDYIVDLYMYGKSPYVLTERSPFAGTIFPNLVSLTLCDHCTVEKLDAIFSASPKLAEVKLYGAKLACWDVVTMSKVPASLRYLEWRLPKTHTPELIEYLREMDQHEKFTLFRRFLKENPSLTSRKEDAEVYSIGTLFNGPRPLDVPTQFTSTNFLSLLGTDSIFDPRERKLCDWVIGALQTNCTCPLESRFCVLTACMKCSSQFRVTVTGDATADEWTAFWQEVRDRQSDTIRNLQTVVTLQGVSLDLPLDLKDLWAGLLVIQGYSSVTSKNLSKWKFSDVVQVVFRDCKNVALDAGDLFRTFPIVKSVVMDNSTFLRLGENVFEEFGRLEHLCLDGERLHKLIQSSEDSSSFSVDVYNHLTKLHFDKTYAWLGKYLDKNPYLTGCKPSSSIYNFGSDAKSPAYSHITNFLALDETMFKEKKLLRLKEVGICKAL